MGIDEGFAMREHRTRNTDKVLAMAIVLGSVVAIAILVNSVFLA
jgi:hypothetical protein